MPSYLCSSCRLYSDMTLRGWSNWLYLLTISLNVQTVPRKGPESKPRKTANIRQKGRETGTQSRLQAGSIIIDWCFWGIHGQSTGSLSRIHGWFMQDLQNGLYRIWGWSRDGSWMTYWDETCKIFVSEGCVNNFVLKNMQDSWMASAGLICKFHEVWWLINTSCRIYERMILYR